MRAVQRPLALLPHLDEGPPLAARLFELVERRELFLRGHRAGHRFDRTNLRATHTAWFGVGVTTREGFSRGLPIDVLGLVYGQELVRRALGWQRSLVVVADSNAQAAGAEALAVRRSAVQVQRRLRELAAALGLPIDVRLTSTLGRLAEFAQLSASSTTSPGSGLPPYAAHQLAQTEHLRQRGFGLKIGWAWRGAWQDERYFDDLHAREFGTRIASVYVGGGTTLDPRRPRACPYVCNDPTARLLLHPGEDLERKLARAPSIARHRYEKLLGKLARAHGHLMGTRLPPRRPTVLLQDLLETLPWPS
ncbi:hypothetical protein [Paraliomyxa miuraensis]|uniref:hypothetical protein n=1 Tax=Paraliomyxa miuraensis TaxID=376150 RepID=UPI002259BB20|nr:hypothetical protein [Paraliomyxa miuraensis]MCX4245672.1 hypothetical protein [Paraliomyxa miuraensis]